MKILVTGGAGILGTALVERLSADKEVEKIIVYDNLSSGNTDFFFHAKFDKQKVSFVEGDILETRKIQKLVKGVDVVAHLAAVDLKAQDNAAALQMEQVNHWGTAELTYALESSNVRKLLYLSSYKVYGFGAEAKTEESPLGTVSAFGLSKWRGESHVATVGKKIQTTILRPGIVVGLGSVKKIKGVANRFVFDAVVKNRVSIHGDGKQLRPFVSYGHLAEALTKSVKASDVHGVFNLVEANISVLDLLDEVKKVVPDVEFVFANHHLELPSIVLDTVKKEVFPSQGLHFGAVFEEMLRDFSL